MSISKQTNTLNKELTWLIQTVFHRTFGHCTLEVWKENEKVRWVITARRSGQDFPLRIDPHKVKNLHHPAVINGFFKSSVSSKLHNLAVPFKYAGDDVEIITTLKASGYFQALDTFLIEQFERQEPNKSRLRFSFEGE